MRKGLRAVLVVAVVCAGLVPLAGPAGADHCEFSIVTQIDVPGVATFYLDDRSDSPPIPGVIQGPGGTWLYLESNGVEGLQQGGQQVVLAAAGLGSLDEEICTHEGVPDTLLF